MKVLGLIPARGGSRGVPDKNLKPLAGKSLVQRAHEVAMASGALDRVILTTDDGRIAEAASRHGLEVPFERPKALADDESAMIDVVIHALAELATADYAPDAVLLLQPTSPLQKPEHILQAIELLGDCDSVCSVTPVPETLSPHYLMRKTSRGFLDFFLPEGADVHRRQDVVPAFSRDGTLYLSRTRVILEQRSFYGRRCVPLMMDPQESLNIDSVEDWDEAERRLQHVPHAL